MKRRKRKGIGRVIRWAVLLTLPVTAAYGGRGVKLAADVMCFSDEKDKNSHRKIVYNPTDICNFA